MHRFEQNLRLKSSTHVGSEPPKRVFADPTPFEQALMKTDNLESPKAGSKQRQQHRRLNAILVDNSKLTNLKHKKPQLLAKKVTTMGVADTNNHSSPLRSAAKHTNEVKIDKMMV